MAVDSKQFEHAGNQQRIEWRLPGGRAGVFVKGIAKTSAGDERAPDASHLKTKTKIILDDLELVGVGNQDGTQSKRKSNRYHPGERCAKLSPIAAIKIGGAVLQRQSRDGNTILIIQTKADVLETEQQW